MIRRAAWHVFKGRHAPGWRRHLEEARVLARAPAKVFAATVEDLLRTHLDWVATTIPWHRARTAPGSPLSAFPVLSRRDLQTSFEDLRDPTRPKGALRPEASGGSTGEPVRLWHDDDSAAFSFATDVLVESWWGVSPWDRRAILWGDDRDAAESTLRRRTALRLQGVVHLNAFRMDDAAMARFADRLERARPAIVMGYATALDLLASYLLKEGREGVRPRVVRSAAEALSSDARDRIARGFRAPVRDFYGSRECPSLAAECARGRLHVMAHGRVIELVDDRGEPVRPGVPGRVLVTDFKNRAFGLVRYENGDVAAWDEDGSPCACGCPFPRLARVYGRTSDFVTTPSGERVHGEWFTHLFYGTTGVDRFQVRQESLTSVVVATVGPAGEETIAPLLALMRERMGPGVSVTWRRVEEIPTTRTGKHRFTVSEVPFLPGEGR